MAADSPQRKGARGPADARPSFDETLGHYVLDQPLLRSVREHPETAVPWILLGVLVVVAALLGGMPALLLALFFGLPVLLLVRLVLSRRRGRTSAPARTSDPGSPLRLVLILAWVAAVMGSIVSLVMVDIGAGDTGIIRVVALIILLPIAGKALQWVMRQ